MSSPSSSSDAPEFSNSYDGWTIVIGTSSGGAVALEKLLSGLPLNGHACVLIVQHLAPYGSASHLVARIQRQTEWKCIVAEDGAVQQSGHIFVAAPDYHLMMDEEKIWVVRGARENRWRPSIDALFRSAAVARRKKVIGVLLTGYLDDGVAGLAAIKRCGGITVVQDPADAEQPDLPQNALDQVEVDHCLPLDQLTSLLADLILESPRGQTPPESVPSDLNAEARISMRASGSVQELGQWGSPEPVTCPECGGVLWSISDGDEVHFRCHTGHTFGARSLDSAQNQKLEETLWIALRLFQEKQALLQKIVKTSSGISWKSLSDRINEIDGHVRRLKEMLGII